MIDQERKLEVRRRSDTALVVTVNYSDRKLARVFDDRVRIRPEKKSLASWGSTVYASLKLKGIDGRAPPGVEPAA